MKHKLIGIGEVLWDLLPDGPQLGGAPANFAYHACALGAEAGVISRVGDDAEGRGLVRRLETWGLDTAGIETDQTAPTGRVLVEIAADGQPRYTIEEDAAWDRLAGSEAALQAAAGADAICFGTLGQRSPLARETIQRIVAATPAEALRVFDVNLRQRFYDAETIRASLRLASVVKLNEEELPIIAQLCGLRSATLKEMLWELAAQFDLRLAALTLGARGSWLVAGSAEDYCPAPATNLVDTVGAGDAFTATLVLDFLRGLPLGAINRHANTVASYVCSQRGATPVLPLKIRTTPLPQGD